MNRFTWQNIKKRYDLILEAAFLIFIFFYSQLPMRDFDIWFHLRGGEIIAKTGKIPSVEVFSHAAEGRHWIVHEWLFELVAYLLSQIGMWTLPIFISIFVTLTAFWMLRILRSVLKVNIWLSIITVFVFFASVYEFHTVRSHSIGYSFLALELYLILAYIFQGKKWLYATPFITLVWLNFHSSAFISWGLMLAFALSLFLGWIFSRDKTVLKKIKLLLLFAGINLLATLTPPMGITDYKLLYTFFQNREFLSVFVAEWSPANLQENQMGFYTFATIYTLAITTILFVTFKKRAWKENLWTLPLVFMATTGYSATRNLYPALFASLILLGWTFQEMMNMTKKPYRYLIFIPLLVAILSFYGYVLNAKRIEVASSKLFYPVEAAEFARENLKGKMFNDYTYGGYMLYAVYPQLQVFIDGRADLYLCCEMHDYMLLATNKNAPDDEYREFLKTFMEGYDMNIAIVPTDKHNIWRKIAMILNTDPEWALVYWDDYSQIFVKRDGQNDEVIEELEAKYATPYLRDPYLENEMDEAYEEYLRMDKIVKSARTSNTIGYILLQRGEFDEAERRFIEATELDPFFESPYMNLAELDARKGNLAAAINLYNHALGLTNDRGMIYIRLGQLILESEGDIVKAREIWQIGLEKTVDSEAKEQLKMLLEKSSGY